ncbi:peptide chain release factor 2 [Ignavigranum ruoffiae]|nr:peptide chain release factor 2 [Ignavigranum ruoffiae]
MELYEMKQILENHQDKFNNLRGSLDLETLEEEIANYDYQMAQADFWQDAEQAQATMKQANEVKGTYQQLQDLQNHLEELSLAIDLLETSQDEELMKEAEQLCQNLVKAMESYELSLLLSQPHDRLNAILEIHPGAGGTESQDWGSILLRMYQRWAEKKDYSVEVLDYQDGDEAGIKSVTLAIRGLNAYGYLKSEKGIHRLVRISPFDSNSRRHTSFASVEVMPELDESIEVEINPDDLRVDTYRASGAGGQHINKTSSAVRITHIPTGIVTQSQSQRSQFQNRDTAMQLLKAKLYQKQVEEQEAKLREIRGEQKEIGWGSQIRSYVFHPYSMVKDHRTDYEVGNSQAVVDGDLDPFMDAYLRWSVHSDQ